MRRKIDGFNDDVTNYQKLYSSQSTQLDSLTEEYRQYVTDTQKERGDLESQLRDLRAFDRRIRTLEDQISDQLTGMRNLEADIQAYVLGVIGGFATGVEENPS